MPLKEFVEAEAKRWSCSTGPIYKAVRGGEYFRLKVRRVSRSVVLVSGPNARRRNGQLVEPIDGCVPVKQFLAEEALRYGVGSPAIFMRMVRGKYPHVERISFGAKRNNFVRVMAQEGAA